MRTNPTDRMKDPFYAGLIFKAERMICSADKEADALGVSLTDSQIRSCVIKAIKLVQGGSPAIPEETERDRLLRKLVLGLGRPPDDLREGTTSSDGSRNEKPIDPTDWAKALDTVQDSIKTRKGASPGSRYYLQFLHRFVAEALGEG